MKRCEKCKVPLEGVGLRIADMLFKVKPSAKNPNLCNKCEGKLQTKYRCQICDRDIDESVAMMHIKAEEYIINLIKKDHPQWNKDKSLCKECLDYYRRLIKEAEL